MNKNKNKELLYEVKMKEGNKPRKSGGRMIKAKKAPPWEMFKN